MKKGRLTMCNACFEDDKLELFTDFKLELNDRVIVVRDVPCLKCQVCGEITFSDDVSAHLEELVHETDYSLQDTTVIYYTEII